MRKMAYFLLVILSAFQLMHADEQMQHSIFVSPKCVKSSKFGNKRYLMNAKTNDGRIYASVTPKIHQGIWPDFCLKHLQDDPEGCSAWGEEKHHPLGLELNLYGYSHAHIDSELIDRLGHLIYLIPINSDSKNEKSKCNYGACSTCGRTIICGVNCTEGDDFDEEDTQSYDYYLVKRCGCESTEFDKGCNWVEIGEREGWNFCSAPTIYSGYLDWNNKIYFSHLENLLIYLEENSICKCYWPQVNQQAWQICEQVYDELEKILKPFYTNELYEHFSPHYEHNSSVNPMPKCTVWVQKYPYKDGGTRTLQEILSSLLTHAFFYTHYRDILLDFNQFAFIELPAADYSSINRQLIDMEEKIQAPFLKLYTHCLDKHPHPKIYYERGMVLFHQGDTLDSLEDIRRFIAYAENNHYHDFLTSDLYLKEGRLLSECLSYDEAIIALTRAIEKDSANKDAYFERAIAYFETGDFSKALSDYLAYGIRPKKIDPKQIERFISITFGQGIALGMLKGGQDSITEFVPSLLSCFRGISGGIWAFVSSPIEASQEMIDCAHASLEFIKDNTTKEMLCKIVPELQECLNKWDQLDDYTKGRYIGYVIGKYGVDIFIASGSVKAIQLYRNLRRANALMILETASISPKLAQEILEQAVKQEEIRATILKSGNLKIQWDKQGKHIKGHKNYLPEKNKSIFTHENPQKLIDTHAGSGKKYGSHHPGKPGYKEDIDFLELIGYAVDESTGVQMPTTWGRIHYAKDGVHIVPIRPRG